MGVLGVVAAEELLHDPLIGGDAVADPELAHPGLKGQLVVLGTPRAAVREGPCVLCIAREDA